MKKMSDTIAIGERMFKWAQDLFPICRSITGPGVRETLLYLQNLLPGLTIESVPSGQQAFDWTVPDEWIIRDAYICDETGIRVVDFRENNLHVVGYSEPVDTWLPLEELDRNLYSIPDQPTAIPYLTSYYKRRWGFCLSDNQRKRLKPGRYRAVVDSELVPGFLNYGELMLKGSSSQEVLLSTNICHPSMANNELSGPVVTTALAQWLKDLPNRRYTYRIIFVPETIGSIVFLAKNIKELKRNVIAGIQISCVGDERTYSYISSRYGASYADKIISNVLSFRYPGFIKYDFLGRGSDERQFCSPGIDLPVVTFCRSKFGTYPEYHTSLDNLDFITPEGLQGSYEVIKDCIELLEKNRIYKIVCYGEPQLGKRGLYPVLSPKSSGLAVATMMDFIAYADGTNDLIDISNIIGKPVWDIWPVVERLLETGLLDRLN